MTAAISPPEQFGRYRLLSRIGEGGMGTVYLAEDTQLARQVALKVPHFKAGDNPTAVERFYREAKMAAGVSHTNLCGVYDVGEFGGFLFLTMPLIEGQQLARLIDPDRPWEPRQAAELIRRLALAIQVMHARGVIHRDLKPGNVMIRPDGEPILMDFGLARSYEGKDRKLTRVGAQVGSPSYMSPEQVMGQGDGLGPATDIYSLGVMLYQLVTGKLPFEGPVAAVYGQVLNTEPQRPTTLRPGLDRDLETICVKAMAKKPGDRFVSMVAYADALQGFLSKGSTPNVALPAVSGTAGEGNLLRLMCPQCGKNLRLTPDMHGKSIRCPNCKGRIPASETQGPSLTEAPSAPGRPPAGIRPVAPVGPIVPPAQHFPGVPFAPIPRLPVAASAAPAGDPVTLSFDRPQRSNRWLLVSLLGGVLLATAGIAITIVLNSDDSDVPSGKKDETQAHVDKTSDPVDKDSRIPDGSRLPVERPALQVKDLSSVEIPQGNAGVLDVTIERKNFSGAVKLEVAGLPAGMSFTAQPIPQEADHGQVLLTVEPGTKVGPTILTVRAIGADAQMEKQVTVTVSAPPRPTFKLLSVADVELEPGNTRNVDLPIDRQNFSGAIKLLVTAPAGVVVQAPDVSADAAVAKLTITIDKDAIVGSKTVVVNADPGGVGALRTIGVTVIPPKVVKLDPARSGPTTESQAAIAKGLEWLAFHQAPTGAWSLDQFPNHARDPRTRTAINITVEMAKYPKNDPGRGMKNDTAGTGFGLLPFLLGGITHKSAKKEADKHYCAHVQKGLNFLISQQGNDGGFGGGMYAHGIATITICEAYRLTADPALKLPAQKGINYIVSAQDPDSGGWRYQPRSGGDTSVVGWQLMALKTGQAAGLSVPNTTLKGAEKWLNACETKGTYGYTGPGPTPTMTAVGLLCRQHLGIAQRNPNLLEGVDYLLKNAPPRSSRNLYYEYYATQVMYHMGDQIWEQWNAPLPNEKQGMRDILVTRQESTGSWNPATDPFGSQGGRIMTTSLSLLTLQVHSRTPLYQKAPGGP